MRKFFVLVMMCVVSTLAMAQTWTLNVLSRTFNVDTPVVEVKIIFAPGLTDTLVHCSYEMRTATTIQYTGAMGLRYDSVTAFEFAGIYGQTPLYGDSAMTTDTVVIVNQLWFCPDSTMNLSDTLNLGFVFYRSDGSFVDSLFSIPFTIDIDSLPWLSYNAGNGGVSVSAGDWINRQVVSGGQRPGAWLSFRDSVYGPEIIPFTYFISDTTVFPWALLDSAGYTDSCVLAVVWTGEEYCGIWSYQTICRPATVDTYDVIVSHVVAYPNPTKGMVRVNDLADGIITVINASGQKLSIPIVGDQVDLSNCPAGLYNLSITTRLGDRVTTIKVVKE